MARRGSQMPKLDGIPSPGLRRMGRMRPDRLRAHLGQLQAEIEHITTRIDRLAQAGGDESTRATRNARLARAEEQRRRLERLIEEGQRLLRDRAS